MLAMFSLSSHAQDKKKPEPAKERPTASGLYREFSGVVQLGNYGTKPQKKDPQRRTLDIDGQHGIESMDDYFKAEEAPHVMCGTLYFAVFRYISIDSGDTFGTGMPVVLYRHFVPVDGDPRPCARDLLSYPSPRLAHSA